MFSDCPGTFFSVEFRELEASEGRPKLGLHGKCESTNNAFNRIYMRIRSTPTEGFFGFGE